MRTIFVIVLAAILVLATAGVALAADPTVIGANGASAWTYKDLQDTTAKYEGGYAAFDDGTNYSKDVGDGTPGQTDATGPHGGYNTTTNKCKVCHAVHRAEGAYYLLRADSQDDACSYCHVGSAHSSRVVYDLNPDGMYTTNGHTIGAQSYVPDSSIRQTAQNLTLSSTDADGNPISQTIKVRSYDTEKVQMYRFFRQHGQSAVSYNRAGTPDTWGAPLVTGTARSGYQKIGPLALRCMSCHQPHNATNEVWRPRTFTAFTSANYSTAVDGPNSTTGYKLLRRSPAGQTYGAPSFTAAGETTEYYGGNQVIKALEDTAKAGVNYSQNNSAEFTYVENGVTRAAPLWIAQDIHDSGSETGVYRYPAKVNEMALSYWCADCHNLNVGGTQELTNVELGFKAHNERTHPAPYYGAYTGPGQCYSCHRNDLPPQMGLTAAADPRGLGSPAAINAGRESCTQCHFGTGDYYQVRKNAATMQNSDFPHSGRPTDIKLLGSYNISNGNTTGGWTPVYNTATITDTSLDQVCLRCHPGIGINH
jgi:hypothetical protein